MRTLLLSVAAIAILAASSLFKSDVNYGGVSFHVEKALATEIKAETVPASLDSKPSDLWPEHAAFTLIGLRQTPKLPRNFPHLRVFPVQRFRAAVQSGYQAQAKNVVFTTGESWTNDFDEELRVLNALLADKPQSSAVQSFLKRVRHKTAVNTGMPFLPMWEAHQAFISNVKYVNFRNGKGVFFLTQWNTETTRIANDGLVYAFQGITNDGKHHVYAEFSVSAPNLPQGNEPDVLAWNEKNYLLPQQSKQYQDYTRGVVAQLEALRADQFQPQLELFERLISSLAIQPE